MLVAIQSAISGDVPSEVFAAISESEAEAEALHNLFTAKREAYQTEPNQEPV